MGKHRQKKRGRESVQASQKTNDSASVKTGTTQNPRKRQRKSVGGTSKAKVQGISKFEHDSILEALRNVEWSKVVNTSRRNVIPEDAKKEAKGKPFCHSFILGPGMKDPNKRPSYWTTKCPELYQLLQKLMKRMDPNHVYTNITVNKNLRCKAHRDRGNSGMSYICGFGDYTGGELMVGPRRPQNMDIDETKERKLAKPVDLHRKFVQFYGGEQLHWTLPFKGERYTVVFYNFPDLHKSAVAKTKTENETMKELEPEGAFAKRLASLSQKLKKSQKKMFTK